MNDSNKPISPLRQRMIDDMTMRKLSPKTQVGYLRAILKFTRFFGQSPDLASSEDLRAFQLHLVKEGVSATTINATITGLNFFFGVSLDCPSVLKQMSRVHQPRRLPQVLSVEEVERLLAGSKTMKNDEDTHYNLQGNQNPRCLIHSRSKRTCSKFGLILEKLVSLKVKGWKSEGFS